MLVPTGSDEYDVYQTVLALEIGSEDRARGVLLLSETIGGGEGAWHFPNEHAVENDFRSAYGRGSSPR
jgi:hypothetical protein